MHQGMQDEFDCAILLDVVDVGTGEYFVGVEVEYEAEDGGSWAEQVENGVPTVLLVLEEKIADEEVSVGENQGVVSD